MTSAEPGMPEPFPLTSGDPGTQEQWEAAAAAVLRKSRRLGEDADDHDVWSTLATTTLDDLSVTPLGTPALIADLDISARPPVREGGWDVRALVADPDPKQANADLLTDLENGVTSLWLRVGDGGVPVDGLGEALSGVLLDAAPVILESTSAFAAAEALQRVVGDARLAPGSNLGVDPVGILARGMTEDDVKDLQRPGATMRIAEALGARPFVVDGTVVHDRGASDAQELGYVLATGAHYLRQYVEHGMDIADAVEAVDFRLAATDEQFLTIAKLRAVRRLWARVLELSDVPEEQRVMRLHVVTSRPMMTRYDPWVNMLRTTVAAFAAGVGGADAVTVLPFDSPLGVPDALGRRIARNTSALLVEESHVAAVTDPAGGAYSVERLTADLADAAWAELGRLDETGDVRQALPEFWTRVEQVRGRRDRAVATRARAITGLTEYPNLAEKLPERRPAPDDVRRYGAAFEALRDDPPDQPVFLATMGPVARHTARASFAINLLAAGGVSVVQAGATEGVDDVLASYDGQRVVCLAGADATYGEWGAELVDRLREAGATRVVLAGRPGDLAVDDSCAVGVDALEFLTRTRDALEESA